MDLDGTIDRKRMRLRYTGVCTQCGTAVPAGATAIYFRTTKTIACVTCTEASPDPVASAPAPGALPDTGTAGASARREHDRRVAKREERIRGAHPKLGGLILALTDDPQSTTAWKQGAVGEEILGQRLDGLAEEGVLRLHDRRIPSTRANIDHIAISAAGVFVIDAKRYKGTPHLRVTGGILRSKVETLMVGSRDCTKLVDGIKKQVELVVAALAGDPDLHEVPVRGVLCFVDTEWPLIGAGFTTAGIDVLPPAKAVKLITAPGVHESKTLSAYQLLAAKFPAA